MNGIVYRRFFFSRKRLMLNIIIEACIKDTKDMIIKFVSPINNEEMITR